MRIEQVANEVPPLPILLGYPPAMQASLAFYESFQVFEWGLTPSKSLLVARSGLRVITSG